eukprot:TRINITY_DN29194_c0_g1_i1.p2 TRINITY_DN29194_c0_g1~~TRINITY_DN29194_c0_g1_i1.p2  ORF type:complete len:199 (+),score=50.49 TRINITY_DN29194_c0_g1_i1:54-599(+)
MTMAAVDAASVPASEGTGVQGGRMSPSTASENPLRDYAQAVVDSVPSLLCFSIADVHGTTRLHATKGTDWNRWKHLSRLYLEPDQLEQTLAFADNLQRRLQRATLFLDDYVVVQEAHQPPEPAPATVEANDYSPTVVITLVGKAADGEGDVGALLGVLERLKQCPLFQQIASAVVMSSYEY